MAARAAQQIGQLVERGLLRLPSQHCQRRMNCCCRRPEGIKGELLTKTQQFINPYIKPIIFPMKRGGEYEEVYRKTVLPAYFSATQDASWLARLMAEHG
jgi:hypothetical protein